MSRSGPTPYGILAKKRAGESLSEAEIRAVTTGAADGSWSDAQLGAFLMAAVLQGLDAGETRALTLAMLESGEQWDLASEVPLVGDKHSTGGVGDKVSLLLAPLLAACGLPVVMLTGRGLGHTAGTADKLDVIPGLDQALDRRRSLELLESCRIAVGIATDQVAPADRKLYSLRDVTATVDHLPLITGSILSKKLACGSAAMVFDIKTGNGAILPERERGRELGRLLIETSAALGRKAGALITDMSQPLGRWVGHAAELQEIYECLEGGGPEDLLEVTYALCLELANLLGQPLKRSALEEALASGAAREAWVNWGVAQSGDRAWLEAPDLSLAPEEVVLTASEGGVLASVDTCSLGLLLSEAGGGRRHPGDTVDHGVALKVEARLGDEIEAGGELARLYLRHRDEALTARFGACFEIDGTGAIPPGTAPPLVYERLEAGADAGLSSG